MPTKTQEQNLLSEKGLLPAEDIYFLLSTVPNIKFLDATYFLPTMQASESITQKFLSRHIKGAQLFDIDKVADSKAPLPHTVPSLEVFEDHVSAMGIAPDDHVLIYDQSGVYMAAARAWWMFRLFGHARVYVMEGGLGAWVSGGYPVESGMIDPPEKGSYKGTFRPELLLTKDDVLRNISNPSFLLLDARPEGRFNGQIPEPREGMRAGHIPHSLNLPYADVLQRDGRFKTGKNLDTLLEQKGILNASLPFAFTCGSGITACTLALSFYANYGIEGAVYDGSWSEWGDERAQTPISES